MMNCGHVTKGCSRSAIVYTRFYVKVEEHRRVEKYTANAITTTLRLERVKM